MGLNEENTYEPAAIDNGDTRLTVPTGDAVDSVDTGDGSIGTDRVVNVADMRPQATQVVPATPLGELMAAKIGLQLNPTIPKDQFGNPIYTAVSGPYGATAPTTQAQAGVDKDERFNPYSTMTERLRFDPEQGRR